MEDRSLDMFPLREFIGFHLDGEAGTASAWVDLDHRHMNPNNVAHGAIPFTLMDTAMGRAAMSVLDDGLGCATLEMHTRFHRPAVKGTITAIATVLQQGRRILHLEAKTTNEQGKLVASATASFAVIEVA